MKKFIGIVLIIIGIIAGLYIGGYLLFVVGLIDIVSGIVSVIGGTTGNGIGSKIAIGIVKVVSSSAVGVLTFLFCSSMGSYFILKDKKDKFNKKLDELTRNLKR